MTWLWVLVAVQAVGLCWAFVRIGQLTVADTDLAKVGTGVAKLLELLATVEATRVRVEDGVPRREVTRELRLLALAPGVATIGSVRVRWSEQSAETAPITITVRAAGATAIAASLAPRVRAVLDTLRPPPPGDDVVVEVLPLPDAVTLGEQLDLITLAWFPRELRLQLRTPPTLAAPAVEGVWAYDQTTQAGVVTSRRSSGRWFDLYVSHQVVFPLSAGVVTVGQRRFKYSEGYRQTINLLNIVAVAVCV